MNMQSLSGGWTHPGFFSLFFLIESYCPLNFSPLFWVLSFIAYLELILAFGLFFEMFLWKLSFFPCKEIAIMISKVWWIWCLTFNCSSQKNLIFQSWFVSRLIENLFQGAALAFNVFWLWRYLDKFIFFFVLWTWCTSFWFYDFSLIQIVTVQYLWILAD